MIYEVKSVINTNNTNNTLGFVFLKYLPTYLLHFFIYLNYGFITL